MYYNVHVYIYVHVCSAHTMQCVGLDYMSDNCMYMYTHHVQAYSAMLVHVHVHTYTLHAHSVVHVYTYAVPDAHIHISNAHLVQLYMYIHTYAVPDIRMYQCIYIHTYIIGAIPLYNYIHTWYITPNLQSNKAPSQRWFVLYLNYFTPPLKGGTPHTLGTSWCLCSDRETERRGKAFTLSAPSSQVAECVEDSRVTRKAAKEARKVSTLIRSLEQPTSTVS